MVNLYDPTGYVRVLLKFQKQCEPRQDTQDLLFLESSTHAINGAISQEHFSFCDFFSPPSVFYKAEEPFPATGDKFREPGKSKRSSEHTVL